MMYITHNYGCWAGNPNGKPENMERCVEEVFEHSGISHQCFRKRGFGRQGLYCKQHATIIEKRNKRFSQVQS